MTTNPYAPPMEIGPIHVDSETFESNLAGRFTRLVATLVDGLLQIAITLPIQFATGYFARAQTQSVGVVEQLLEVVLSIVVMLGLNGYLLASRGQSIGKLLTKIQIVDAKSGTLLPFANVFVYRYFWSLPVAIIFIFIPGTTDDQILNIIVLLGILLIFGAERRCLHDYIAGSRVVLYRPERNRSVR